jgi:hypothetical protein
MFGALQHLAGCMTLDGIDDRVVDFEIVGHGNERPILGRHPGWDIVDDPIAYIAYTGLLQKVGGDVRLAQPRRQPAPDLPPCKRLNFFQASGN